MVDPEDAKKIVIPMCMLASSGEDKEAVANFEKNLKTPHHVETFADQVHVSDADFEHDALRLTTLGLDGSEVGLKEKLGGLNADTITGPI